MDFDRVVDNKFLPRQTHSVVRDKRLGERLIRLGEIHHYFHFRFFDLANVCFFYLKIKQPFIDVSFLAFRAVDCYVLSVFDNFRRISRSHHAGNSKLPRDNRRVASSSAGICHNRRGDFHNRFPVRISHLRNQNFSSFKTFNTAHILDKVNLPFADFISHARALN